MIFPTSPLREGSAGAGWGGGGERGRCGNRQGAGCWAPACSSVYLCGPGRPGRGRHHVIAGGSSPPTQLSTTASKPPDPSGATSLDFGALLCSCSVCPCVQLFSSDPGEPSLPFPLLPRSLRPFSASHCNEFLGELGLDLRGGGMALLSRTPGLQGNHLKQVSTLWGRSPAGG